MAFGTTVGGTPLVKAYVGTTPAQRIYVGDKHVWPPFSTTVTYVGSQVFTGTASTNFPTHKPNDVLVIYAVGGAAPTAPPGWTAVPTGQSGNPAGTLAYRYATSTSASTGTWTGNAAGVMYVFRDTHPTTPFGTIGTSVGSGAVTTAPAITLTDPSGGSLVAHNYYNNGTTGSWTNKAPANFIIKNLNARMASTLAISTVGTDVVASSLTHSSATTWRSLAFEVLPVAPVVEEPLWLYDVEQVNKGGGVVDFTLKKGLEPFDPLDEGFMFRCAQFSTLNGYVPRTFSKTFPTNAYSALDCTVEDLYGDGTANPDYLHKIISFQVTPRYGAAADAVAAAMPAGTIKGNADSGLYHIPGDPHYDETIAEQWFTTEAEAKAAGFIKYTKRRKKS